MTRRLKYDVPGVDWRVTTDELRERGFAALFADDVAKPLPLVVEIGFGRGEFLMELARRHPEQAFVGIEYSAKRTLKMARRLARTEIRNVRLVEATAEEVVGEHLDDESVVCFWINFPDPWPKKRHFKRRLIRPAFVELLVRRLVPDGRIEIATDHEGYAEWIDDVLRVQTRLENLNAPKPFLGESPAGRTPTAYELDWRALGHPFHFFSYRRRSG